MRPKVAFALIALACLPLEAPAALVSYAFQGTINDITDTSSPIDNVGGITIGSTFTGSFQFETTDAGSDLDADPTRGLYILTGSASSITATINGLTFTAGPGAVDVRNNVVSSLSNNSDFLNYTGGTLDTLPAGWSFSPPAGSGLQIAFIQGAGTELSSDGLPTSFDPNQWDFAQLFLQFTNVTFPGGTDSGVSIIGDVTLAPAAVPEPSAMTLLGLLGLSSIAVRRVRPRPA